MSVALKKSKSKNEIKDEFSVDEGKNIDLCGFSDGESKIEGTVLRTFSFNAEDEAVENFSSAQAPSKAANADLTINENLNNFSEETDVSYNKSSRNSNTKKEIVDHRTLKANPNGRTPPVDGEAFDMVRTYSLRRSTVRILSKIKAIHSDDNVYLNTIVDEAIRHYYEYLKNSLKE